MTSDNAIPRLVDDVPGAPRTETQLYRFQPGRPCAPPARDCTDGDLRQLIADALGNHSDLLALLGSPDHVRRILALANRLDLQLAARSAELVGERLEVLRLAGLHRESSRLLVEVQTLHRVISAENIELRRRASLDSAFDRAAKAVTGRSAAELAVELEDQTLRYPALTDTDDRFDDTEVADVEDPVPTGGAS